MTEQNESLFSINKAKGGPGKVPREDSIEDSIVQMAEAHARVAKATHLVLNNDIITAMHDRVLVAILPDNVAYDIRSYWSNLYREAFWRIYRA